MKKILIIILGIIIAGFGFFYLMKKNIVQAPSNVPIVSPVTVPAVATEKAAEGVINAVNFSCAKNKTIGAIFFKDKVELSLSDKRNIFISQGISASGARYVNQDESFVFWNKGDTAFIEEKGVTTYKDCIIVPEQNYSSTTVTENTNTGLANPASVNCSKAGGNLVIESKADGSQYGLCYFEDNRACEEWALMRGDCLAGGVKTTGFDTIDQKFCAWSGGSTSAVKNSICTFKNGSKCATLDFYNGKCIAK